MSNVMDPVSAILVIQTVLIAAAIVVWLHRRRKEMLSGKVAQESSRWARSVGILEVLNLVTALGVVIGVGAATFIWGALVQVIVGMASYGYVQSKLGLAGDGGDAARWASASAAQAKDLVPTRIPWLPIIVSGISMAAAASIVASAWDDIPQTVITHWGSGFEPDGWSEKNVGSVFGLSFVCLGMWLFMQALIVILVHSQRKDLVQPGKTKAEVLRQRVGIDATATGLGWMLTAVIVSISLLQIAGYYPGFEDKVPGTLVAGLLTALGGAPILMVYVVQAQGRIEDVLRQAGISDPLKVDSNDSHYKWGMFYYNPSDPTVMVEKRFGVGVDFNYATWQGKAFIAFVLVTLAIGLALPFFV